jgi:hypothetical protein
MATTRIDAASFVSKYGYIKQDAQDVNYGVSNLDKDILSHTANNTPAITSVNFSGHHDNAGSGGAITLALPTDLATVKGESIRITCQLATNIVIQAGSTIFWVHGVGYDTVTLLGVLQASIEIYCDGISYYVTGSDSGFTVA